MSFTYFSEYINFQVVPTTRLTVPVALYDKLLIIVFGNTPKSGFLVVSAHTRERTLSTYNLVQIQFEHFFFHLSSVNFLMPQSGVYFATSYASRPPIHE